MKHAPHSRPLDRPDDFLADAISLDIVMIAGCCVVAVAALIYLLAI